jgi:hypothetical protein
MIPGIPPAPPVMKAAAVLARVAVITVIAWPHQPATFMAQRRGQTWLGVGMLLHLPVELVVAHVVEQPGRGTG